MNNALHTADILLPRPGVDLTKWAVVACDQFTAQPEYWERAEALVGEAPSALRLILPEAWLAESDTRVPAISILNAAGEHGIKVFEGILYLTFSRPEYPTAKDHDDADRLYMERLAREAPPDILIVKLADRVCNTRDFMKDPPKDEPTKPARYLHEADPILAAVSRVPSAYVEAVKATIEELKRQVGYADWTPSAI